MSKATKSRGAETRWNYEAIRDVLPKVGPKPQVPRTHGIEANSLDALIQVDSSVFADRSNAMLGRDEFRTRRELVADQIVDAAKGRLAEWEENEENFKNHTRYDIGAMAKRAAESMNRIQGTPDAIHNTSALEQAEQLKAERLDRRIEWRIDFWNRRLKDLQDAVEEAMDRQADMRLSIDEQLALKEDDEEFVDERTKEQAFLEHYMKEVEGWSDEDLVMLMSTHDTIAPSDFCPGETHKLLSWKANVISNERMVVTWKRAKARKARLIEELMHEDRTGTSPISKGERHWRMIDINQKAVKAHGTKEAEVLLLENLIPMLGWKLVKEGENMASRRINKLRKAEVEFWDRQDDPLRAVKAKEAERFWFDDGDGGYLDGSCTDIKYICNDGSID